MPNRKPKRKAGEHLGSWTLRRFVEAGGNGEVWEAVAEEGGTAAAFKVLHLHRSSGEGYTRFRREVEILQELDPTDVAILPIIDSHLPAAPSKDDPAWYAMPLATGIREALRESSLPERVDAVRQIAHTLAVLAPRLNHRDVKPANLYQHDGRFVIGDFGLAKRPEVDDDMTGDRPLGPWAHLPSEVFIRLNGLDWEKVDVHCLANTLWQIVANAPSPPRGPIAAGGEYDLARRTGEDYAGQLSVLIAGATDETPEARPSLAEFAQQLGDWLEGREIRDSLQREDERARWLRHEVLRYLVAWVRREPHLNSFAWEIESSSAPSGIGDLSDGEVSEALDELRALWHIQGDRVAFGGGTVRWSHLYPTLLGVQQVEHLDVLLAQSAPLLRAIYDQPLQLLSLSRERDSVTIGQVTVPTTEAFFQLRLLEGNAFIEFREKPGGGGGVALLDLKVTSHGRGWLVQHYS